MNLFPLVEQAYDQKLTLQIVNVLGYILMILLNAVSSYLPMSLRDITNSVDTRISPASYAFSIWGLIYSLIGVFVVYQALPDDWVPDRNDDLIYN